MGLVKEVTREMWGPIWGNVPDEQRPVRAISFGWAGARMADLPRQQIDHASGATRRPGEQGPFLADADVVAIGCWNVQYRRARELAAEKFN